jgi:hypothetical protein
MSFDLVDLATDSLGDRITATMSAIGTSVPPINVRFKVDISYGQATQTTWLAKILPDAALHARRSDHYYE